MLGDTEIAVCWLERFGPQVEPLVSNPSAFDANPLTTGNNAGVPEGVGDHGDSTPASRLLDK
jgi:hypothetical protein